MPISLVIKEESFQITLKIFFVDFLALILPYAIIHSIKHDLKGRACRFKTVYVLESKRRNTLWNCYSIIVIFSYFIANKFHYVVRQQSVAIIERLGRYQRTSSGGMNFRILWN